MKERLIEFLSYLGIGQTKFEEQVGLSRGLINNIKGGLSSTTINKISDKYPELNTNWLLTGEGEMMKTAINQSNVNGDNIAGHSVTVNKTQTDKFLDLLKAKDEQINKSQAQIDKSQEQIDKSQSQIDRLIGLLEKVNG